MKNWKTTVAGVGFAVLNILLAGPQTPDGKINWSSFAVSAGIAALGALAKDHNVTGGTVQQPNH